MSHIQILPPELLETLCDYLPPDDLKNFGLSCKTIYEVICRDQIWRNVISRQYRIEPHQYPSIRARLFYWRILQPYGTLLGRWIMSFEHCDGLLRVVVEDGCIIGEEILSLPMEHGRFRPFVKKRVFRIQSDGEKEGKESHATASDLCASFEASSFTSSSTTMVCLLGKDESPSLGCEGERSMQINQPAMNQMFIRCRYGKQHKQKMRDLIFRTDEDFTRQRVNMYQQWMTNEFFCRCAKIQLDSFTPSVPPFSAFLPPPGFFVGDYDGGTVIVMVEYRWQGRDAVEHGFTIGHTYSFPANENQDIRYFFKATKVAGNLPPGESLTIRASLDQPVFPTREEQESFESLEDVECQVPPSDYATQPAMPFYLPSGFRNKYHPEEVPQQCYARFKARIESTRGCWLSLLYDAQLVVFNPNRFGIFRFGRFYGFFLFVREDNAL